MSKDRIYGLLMFVGSLIGVVVYGWLMFMTGYGILVLQISVFLVVAVVLGIVAWIGYTLASTPPPKPIEEIEKEFKKTECQTG